MTPEQIQIVRSTFGRVYRQPEAAAALFYDRLFTIAPQTRALFKGDMPAQGKKLMDTLNVAIGTLRDPKSLTAMLERLGRAHSTMGVQDRHYDLVGEALLWTLEQALGRDFTPAVKEAWAMLYGAVASTMKGAGAATAAKAA